MPSKIQEDLEIVPLEVGEVTPRTFPLRLEAKSNLRVFLTRANCEYTPQLQVASILVRLNILCIQHGALMIVRLITK